MAGTNLYAWGKAGASMGANPGKNPSNAAIAAFSPGATVSVSSQQPWWHPSTPFGMALWTGAGAIVLLALIRHSLPR